MRGAVPLLPKDSELLHCPGGATHAGEEDVDAGIIDAPESIAEVERAIGQVWGVETGVLGEGGRGCLSPCGHLRRAVLGVCWQEQQRGEQRGLAAQPKIVYLYYVRNNII